MTKYKITKTIGLLIIVYLFFFLSGSILFLYILLINYFIRIYEFNKNANVLLYEISFMLY